MSRVRIALPRPTPTTIKRPRPTNWGMTKTEQRASVQSPIREDLTNAQWYEWGCGLKELRQYGVPHAERLSLSDQRDLIHTIRVNAQVAVCKMLSAVA